MAATVPEQFVVELPCLFEHFGERNHSCAAVVELRFGDWIRNRVDLHTRLVVGAYAWGSVDSVFGFEIVGFANQLAALHRNLKGKASLKSDNADDVITVTVADPGRGTILVGGNLSTGLDGAPWRKHQFVRGGGVHMAFDGLIMDQSCLPSIVSKLRQYLTETDIDVTDHTLP